MKSKVRSWGVLIGCVWVLIGWSARAEADPWADLTWLPGCWAAEGGEAGSGEMWMSPAAGVMFGLGRTIQRGQVVAHEVMQIRVGPQGKLEFVAKPSGQKEAIFPLKSLVEGAVTFEALAHDFPQRIRYRPVGRDRILARIEGLKDGKPIGIDFPLRRIRCEVGTP